MRIAANSRILDWEIVVMKGIETLAEGTLGECAEKLDINPETLRFYLTPAYERRLAKRKNLDNSRTVIRLDDEDEDDAPR